MAQFAIADTGARTAWSTRLLSSLAAAFSFAVLVLAVVHTTRHPLCRALGGTRAGGQEEADTAGDVSLFSQIDADLAPFSDGITLEMVEQAYCGAPDNGFRLQVVNGRMFVAGYRPGLGRRLPDLLQLLLAVARKHALPDVDVVVHQEDHPKITPTTDACPRRGPITCAAKQLAEHHAHALLAPDHTFTAWAEVHTLPWEAHMQMVEAFQSEYPWERRNSTLFFRSNLNTDFRRVFNDNLLKWKAEHAAEASSMLDIVLDPNIFGPQFTTMLDQGRYKYLLYLPGVSYSNRWKYLLLSGAAVLMHHDPAPAAGGPWMEFWSHLLQNGTNVINITGPTENMVQRMVSWVQWLRDHDEDAKRIGHAGHQLISQRVSMHSVLEYWHRLLSKYAALQRFNVTRHPDAVMIEEQVTMNAPVARTCTLCVFA